MKLRDVAKGTRAVKRVKFRLANAPIVDSSQPGQEPPADPHTIEVGVRVLTGAEAAEVYEKAQSSALEKGVGTWDEEHPLCSLHVMVYTILLACVDADAEDSPFFASADEILESPEMGTDNIAWLHEQQVLWQDECSFQAKNLTNDQVVAILIEEAAQPENADSPLERMRPGLRRSFLRTTARLFVSLLTDRSDSGLPFGAGGSSPSTKPSGAEGTES